MIVFRDNGKSYGKEQRTYECNMETGFTYAIMGEDVRKPT